MISALGDVTEFPLCWPDNKPRAAQRHGSPFRTSMAKAQREVETEMQRWRAISYTVSMAPQFRQGAVDPGVALWWSMHGHKTPEAALRVLACDTYLVREANLHAIALTLEGLRAFERYGTYSREQAVEGARLALPPPEDMSADWRKTLGYISGLPNDKQLVLVEHTYRRMSAEVAGDEEKQRSLNLAIETARKELRPEAKRDE